MTAFYGTYNHGIYKNGLLIDSAEIVDTLDSIAAKDAEIERLSDLSQQRIVTRCPSCGSDSLFIGHGGHLTCSVIGCKNPSVEDEIEKLKATIAERDRIDAFYEETHGKSVARAMTLLDAGNFDNIDHAAEKAVNNIKALEAELDRLRVAVKPKASAFEVVYQGQGDGYGVFPVAMPGQLPNRKAWFDNLPDAEQYVRDHQPKPVFRWVSRDSEEDSTYDLWLEHPQYTDGDWLKDSGPESIIEKADAEMLGIPAISPDECHRYSVLDGVWTRVEEPK